MSADPFFSPSPHPESPVPARHLAADLLEGPPRGSHVVQFYDDRRFLFETVGRFLAAGARNGDALLVVAAPPHIEGICAALGSELARDLMHEGQLTLLDARQLLGEFMREGTLFEVSLPRDA